MNIIQAYAPTADKDDNEIESFYQQIDTILCYVSWRYSMIEKEKRSQNWAGLVLNDNADIFSIVRHYI